MSGATIVVSGDADFRIRNNGDFATDTNLVVGMDANLIVGGELRTNDILVNGDLAVLAKGNILRNGGTIQLSNLKIASANGQIGASSADPIVVSVDRVDARAAGGINISDADCFNFGRFGLQTADPNGVNLGVSGGTFESVSDRYERSGSGTLNIEASDNLAISMDIVSTGGGEISISSDGDIDVLNNIESGSGRVVLISGDNVTVVGTIETTSGNIEIDSGAALTVSGELSTTSGRVDHTSVAALAITSEVSTSSGEIDIDSGATISVEDSILSSTGASNLTSNGDLSIVDLVRTSSDDIVIDSARVLDSSSSENISLEARNGRVTIGVDLERCLRLWDIEIASDELSARTTVGTLSVELRDTTELVSNGLRIDSGSGQLIANQTTGSLILNGDLRHYGSGLLIGYRW